MHDVKAAPPAPGQLRLWGSVALEPVGVRLREARLSRGWTQGRLASAVGVDQSSISRFESRAMSPTFEDTVRVARALEVPLRDLLGATPARPQHHMRGEQRASISDSRKLARKVSREAQSEFVHAGGSLTELRKARDGLRHLSAGAAAILVSLGVAPE